MKIVYVEFTGFGRLLSMLKLSRLGIPEISDSVSSEGRNSI